MTEKLGITFGVVAATIWGGMYVVSKIVLEVIPPFGLLSLRLLLGIITLSIFAWHKKEYVYKYAVKRRIIGIGALGFGVSLALQMIGTKLSSAANAAVVTAATPTFVFIFSYLIMNELITKRRYVALGLSSIGVIAVIDPVNINLSPNLFMGNIALVAAAISWGLYSVLVRRESANINIISLSLLAFWGGLLIALPLGIWEYNQNPWSIQTINIGIGVLYLGIISTALAAYLWNKAFELLDASIASLTFFAQPVVGVMLGIIVLNEKITPLFIVGGVMIGVGLVIAAIESEDK